ARASASTLLWKHWDIEFASFAVREFQQMMHGSAKERLAALRSLINTGDSRYAQYLKGYIDDDDESVRKGASLALAQLVDSRSRNLIHDVTEMLHNEDAALRLAVFEALKRIDDSACIPILLEHADFCTPYERRLAQQVILHLGLKSIPTCVRVLKNDTISYAGRSIAARAVAQMAFPQMQSLAPVLVESEIQRAYQMIYCSQVLHEQGGHQNGVTALSYYYQDEQVRSLGFILEILSLGGQIANHEMIAASLWSSSQNTRSNAIETLEQSVSKSVYKKLLPLVDGRSRASKVEFYRKNFKSETMTLEQVIEFAWESSNPLEKTIAIQSKFEQRMDAGEHGRESASQLLQSLCEKLGDAENIVRNVLNDMVKKLDVDAVDSIVDRLVCIKRTEIFSAVPVFELQRLAQKIKLLEYQAENDIYQIGDAANCFYVIQEGCVKMIKRNLDLAAGDIFGDGVIAGTFVREDTAKAKTPVKAYQIHCDDLAESGKIYPNLSIRLHSVFALK
ncbi:cyclic nucleotide-binding domain-containing protein, partial [bacterium]|nr:cyclic nucleotide-binding domain-containing protein [bacterium]